MVTQAGRSHREACYARSNEGNRNSRQRFHERKSSSFHFEAPDVKDIRRLVTSVSFSQPQALQYDSGRLEPGEMCSMRAERGLQQSAQ